MNPFFCWHRWTKWTAPRAVTGFTIVRGTRYERELTVQDRKCDKCGKYEVREVEL